MERGRVVVVLERPFEVWRDPAGLAPALAAMARELGGGAPHGVTMTAELADCYRTKAQGVRSVLAALREAVPGGVVRVVARDGSLLDEGAAAREPLRVAGANWRAAAEWLAWDWPWADRWRALHEADRRPDLHGADQRDLHRAARQRDLNGAARPRDGCVLADVGSTTTDLVPLEPGRVLAEGVTDLERLLAGELVYTGLLRTPLCALLRTVPFRGRACPVAAEHFAIAADAHVWLGDLAESDYTCPTPDGGPVTREGAAARLARVVCADLETLAPDDVTAIARAAREEQLARIARALARVAARLGRRLAPESPIRVVAAGSGSWMAREAARRCGLDCEDLGARIGRAARVLPAFAAAALLSGRDGPLAAGPASAPPAA